MKTKIVIFNSVLISSFSTICNGAPQLLTMTVEDYEKIEFISNKSESSKEQTILIGLEEGTIVIDPAGVIRVNKSIYDILMEQNLIEVENTSMSTMCVKSHSN